MADKQSKEVLEFTIDTIERFERSSKFMMQTLSHCTNFLDYVSDLQSNPEEMAKLNAGLDEIDDYELQDLIDIRNKVSQAKTWIENNFFNN